MQVCDHESCGSDRTKRSSSSHSPQGAPSDTVVYWDEPISFWSMFTHWTWCWSFCPLVPDDNNNNNNNNSKKKKSPCDELATPSVTSDEQSISDDDDNIKALNDQDQVRLTTIDNIVPVIRQPPPVQVQTTWSSEPQTHPSIVYIYNLPKNTTTTRPSILRVSDRLTSVDTLTVSGDEHEASDDDDDDYSLEEVPPPPPLIHRNVPPRPPLHATTSTAAAANNAVLSLSQRPDSVCRRTTTFGSCTTQSSRHRRSTCTVSPEDVKAVFVEGHYNDDDTILSEATPFAQLEEHTSPLVHPKKSPTDNNNNNKTMEQQEPREHSSSPPLPKLVTASVETTSLEEDEEWMETWMQAWVSGAPTIPGAEAETRRRQDIVEPQEEVIDICSLQQEESTYLYKCLSLEQSLLSIHGGSEVVFGGWVCYHVPNGSATIASIPSRHDVVYLVLLQDVPTIFLARADGRLTTIDVTPRMRVAIQDISKSHGRAVILQQDGLHTGTLLPILLSSSMMDEKDMLVGVDEFQELAHRTIAPFCRPTDKNKSSSNDWQHSEYHQEYAPTAQLEAAMHLMFVMDCWMTKMSRATR